MKRYRRLADGEVRRLKGRRGAFAHKIKCCDCALVHKVLIEVRSPSKANFTAWRDNRATAAARRHKRKGIRI